MEIRMILSIVLFIIFSVQSCTTQNDKKEEAFSKVLSENILDYMSSTERRGGSFKYVYYMWGDSIGNNKYIFLRYGLCYEKDKICSYTFLDDKLIIFNEPHREFPFKGWINLDVLVKFKDSIPNLNYMECSSIENFPDFDPVTRQLEIVSQDSLRIVGTSMGQFQLFSNEKYKYLQKAGKEDELMEWSKKRLSYIIPAVQPAKFIPLK